MFLYVFENYRSYIYQNGSFAFLEKPSYKLISLIFLRTTAIYHNSFKDNNNTRKGKHYMCIEL